MDDGKKQNRKYICEITDRHYRRLVKQTTNEILLEGQSLYLSTTAETVRTIESLENVENSSTVTRVFDSLSKVGEPSQSTAGEAITTTETIENVENSSTAIGVLDSLSKEGEPSRKIAKVDNTSILNSENESTTETSELRDNLVDKCKNVFEKKDKFSDPEVLRFLEITEEDILNDYRYSDDESDDEEIHEISIDKSSSINPVDNFIENAIFTTASTREKTDRADLLCEAISTKLENVVSVWAVEKGIKHDALKKLLHDISDEIPVLSLPLDSRTLLNTPKEKPPVKDIKNGKFVHFGLFKCIEKIIRKRLSVNNTNRNIKLKVGSDGAPTGNSSDESMWLLYCEDTSTKGVEVISIFCGSCKPEDPNEFLRSFVDEAKKYVERGVQVDGILFKVTIHALIFDAPAKSLMLGTKHHSGRYSCSKCNIEGDTTCGMHFPGKMGELRTDDNFKKYNYMGTYQQRETILNEIPKLGLVTNVVLDAMHLVYLGVMRKLLFIWIASRIHKIQQQYLDIISNMLLSFQNFIPYEFSRKPRGLKVVKMFKATELRTILGSLGVVAFRDCLSKDRYANFLELHVAITILNSPVLIRKEGYLDYAESLLSSFVKHYEKLYGKDYVTFNIHNLLHLTDDARKYGTLEEFSAFAFENFIGVIKRMIRKGDRKLEQIYLRCAELEHAYKVKNMNSAKIVTTHEHSCGPLLRNFENAKQYKFLNCDRFKLNCGDKKNNCVLIDNNHVVEILNIVKLNSEMYVIGKKMTLMGDIYTVPMRSSQLDINVVCYDQESFLESWHFDRISAKLMILPFESKYVTFPILHTYKTKDQ